MRERINTRKKPYLDKNNMYLTAKFAKGNFPKCAKKCKDGPTSLRPLRNLGALCG
jgi:hypothetical protein